MCKRVVQNCQIAATFWRLRLFMVTECLSQPTLLTTLGKPTCLTQENCSSNANVLNATAAVNKNWSIYVSTNTERITPEIIKEAR
jgi:hypothetical protein